jgi:hypothetical protein
MRELTREEMSSVAGGNHTTNGGTAVGQINLGGSGGTGVLAQGGRGGNANNSGDVTVKQKTANEIEII